MKYAVIEVSTKVAGVEQTWQAEAPQIDTFDELVSIAGGPDKALDWANGHLSTDAGNAGRPLVRNLTIPANVRPGTDEFNTLVQAAIGKAQAASRGYTPQGARAPGVKAKAAAFDEMLARVKRGEAVDDAYLETLASQFGA